MLKKKVEIEVSFKDFLKRFPEVEMPVTLGENSHFSFSEHNKPLHVEMIGAYLEPYLGPSDEFTEYISCFRIPETHNFEALVCWRADLNSYQYFLISYTKKGEYIDHKFIAGMKWESEKMLTVIATMVSDWIIYQNMGTHAGGNLEEYKESSRVRMLELLPDGKITTPQ